MIVTTKNTITKESPLIKEIDKLLSPISFENIIGSTICSMLAFFFLWLCRDLYSNIPHKVILIVAGFWVFSVSVGVLFIVFRQFKSFSPITCKSLVDIASKDEMPMLIKVIQSKNGYPTMLDFRKLNSRFKKIAKANQKIAEAEELKSAMKAMGIDCK